MDVREWEKAQQDLRDARARARRLESALGLAQRKLSFAEQDAGAADRALTDVAMWCNRSTAYQVALRVERFLARLGLVKPPMDIPVGRDFWWRADRAPHTDQDRYEFLRRKGIELTFRGNDPYDQ